MVGVAIVIAALVYASQPEQGGKLVESAGGAV
jgi:hypothetical protein